MEKGYKQTSEHIEKRKRFGNLNYAWKGNDINDFGARERARRLYPSIGPCVLCGNAKSQRHHKDGNPRNNAPENIIIVCMKCHMKLDGRYERFKTMGARVFSEARKALMLKYERRRLFPACARGHLWSDGNAYYWRNQKLCKACRREDKAKRKAKQIAK